MAKRGNTEIGAKEMRLWTWTWGGVEVCSVQGKFILPSWRERPPCIETRQVQRNMTQGLMGYEELRNFLTALKVTPRGIKPRTSGFSPVSRNMRLVVSETSVSQASQVL
jgi:hypothetical protein